MMCNCLNSTFYSVYNQCRHWEYGTTDMRVDLAMLPVWRPLHCTSSPIKLQSLHCNLLEGLRLCNWPSEWISWKRWGKTYVQKIYHWVYGNRSWITWVNYWSPSPLRNVPHCPWKYLQGLSCWHSTPEILITSSIQNYHFQIPIQIVSQLLLIQSLFIKTWMISFRKL